MRRTSREQSMIENDRGLSSLIDPESVRKLCTGFAFTEGPVWIPQDSCLLFSDIPGNRIHRWRPGEMGAETYREPSRHANGLAINAAGNLLACEHSGRQVSIGAYGQEGDSLVDSYQGARLSSPNDIVVRSDGAVYFTDPPFGLDRVEYGTVGLSPDLDVNGVYRVGPSGDMTLVIDDLDGPNGLAFSPDESQLYVGDSGRRRIYQYRVQSDGSVSDPDTFVDMTGDSRRGSPDGMKVDQDGRLWTTGAGGVWVIEPDSRVLGQFTLPEHPSNLAFGGDGRSTLYITAQTSVYSVETNTRGAGMPGI